MDQEIQSLFKNAIIVLYLCILTLFMKRFVASPFSYVNIFALILLIVNLFFLYYSE